MYEKKKWTIIDKHNQYMKNKSAELERFCDFLGNIISKYIHEINFDDDLLDEKYNDIPTIDISWSDIKKELMK